MALEDKKITKLYYSIGEVSKLFGVNNSLIRFWEKEFSIIKPKKNKKGNRYFTEKDVVLKIEKLGMSIVARVPKQHISPS